MSLISAEDLLQHSKFALLDVRAEVEFADGHLPGSANLPILTTQERHEVGLAYKQEGPAAAMALGYALVSPHRAERVEGWLGFLKRQEFPVLTCFRGGSRSEIAQEWIAGAGGSVTRVRGGYKALRRALAPEWEKPLRGFVVTGLTGADKTGFLRSLGASRALDLEAMAVHRGSAFGGLFQPTPQPAQQTFENALSLALLRERAGGDFLFEDESRLVGRCVIPPPFFERMRTLPRIFLAASDEQRAEHVYEVYVAGPLRTLPEPKVMGDLVLSLRSIRNRLGGQTADELERQLRAAFLAGSKEQHLAWILRLLRDYYDGLYRHAMARHPGEPVFHGDAAACTDWLRENSDLLRW